MGIYTNAMDAMVMKKLITNQTEIKVYPFDQPVPESAEVDLFLFDDHLLKFNHIFDKVCLYESIVLRKRPDWCGTVFEMMKNNKHVFLFDLVWYQVGYKADTTISGLNGVTHLASWQGIAVSCLILFCRKTNPPIVTTANDVWREASRSTDGRTLPRTMS